MQQALYGERGFYRQDPGPSAHFRTSVEASPLHGQALARLVGATDESLGHPTPLDVVDMGAADGSLLRVLLVSLPDETRARTRAVGVELRPRPPDLPDRIGWASEVPPGINGVVLANEWLDNIPVAVVERSSGGLRTVLVDTSTGAEELGDLACAQHVEWIERWWPLHETGTRAEVGVARDQAWSAVLRRLDRGTAVAIDYSHRLDERRGGAFPVGTLTGYRNGHQVRPVPDGSCDITAHVALDACAAASGETTTYVLTSQRAALTALGVDAARPAPHLAGTSPAHYLGLLAGAGEAAELLDPAGLGSFGWLLQTKGVEPAKLLALGEDDASV